MITNEADPMRTAENPERLIAYLKYGKDYARENEINRVLFSGTFNTYSENLDESARELSYLSTQYKESKKKFKKQPHTIKHYVISLNAGEHLDAGQWRDVALTHLRDLGVEEHLAIYTVHKDTDNEHLHLVVNEVNPQTLKKCTFSFSHRKTQSADYTCERRYSLKIDNHPLIGITADGQNQTKPRGETQSNDLEAVTGQQTFYSYLNEFLPELEACQSWQELHQTLDKYGVELVKSGRGIVFRSLNPEYSPGGDEFVAVKGSSLGKGKLFSLSHLEDRFGPYQQAQTTATVVAVRHYGAEPVRFNTSESYQITNQVLQDQFETYKELKHDYFQVLSDLKAHTEEVKQAYRKDKRIEQIRYEKEVAALTSQYQQDPQLRATVLYAAKQHHYEINKELKARKDAQLQTLQERLPRFPSNFLSYLTENKSRGFSSDLRRLLLSRKQSMEQRQGNTLEQDGGLQDRSFDYVLQLHYVRLEKRTHKGQEIYQNRRGGNGDWIRDDGKKIMVGKNPSIDTINDFLIIARTHMNMQRPLRIHGDFNFQLMCAVQGARMGMNIQFDDPRIQQFFSQRSNYERVQSARQTQHTAAVDQRAGRGLSRSEFQAQWEQRHREYLRAQRINAARAAAAVASTVAVNTTTEYTATTADVTIIAKATGGQYTPAGETISTLPDAAQTHPEQGNSLSRSGGDLSVLSVGQVDPEERKGSVLLHDPDGLHLGQSQQPGHDSGMRSEVRDPAGGGQGIIAARDVTTDHASEDNKKSPAGQSIEPEQISIQAQTYLDERNQRRRSIPDIKEHKAWDGTEGDFIFRGTRFNEDYLLLEKGDYMYLKKAPLTKDGRNLLRIKKKSLKSGAVLHISASGYITFPTQKSRSI